MEPMNAFEQQLTRVTTQVAGPERSVDAMAIVRSAKAAPERRLSVLARWFGGGTTTPTEGGFSMFSTVKFVVAATIVALFGGFLLMGVLTTPQGDEALPAAVTESPSPMTTDELLSGMVTEEVEPGVFKVVNDGVRDHEYPVGGWGYTGFMVDVTPDGSVWLSARVGRPGLYRLGEAPVFEDLAGSSPYREVAPDGSLWALGEVSDDRRGIFSFDGEVWTMRATPSDDFTALAVGPNGTVWVIAEDGDKHCPDLEDDDCRGTVLLRLEGDGSLTTIEDWADVYDGDAAEYRLAVSPDGDVWLVGTGRVLLRFDGERWERIPSPERWNPVRMGRYLEFGPDGALWMKADAAGDLARFEDPGWTTFTKADGIRPWGETDWRFADILDVAADGSLWLLGSWADGCGGVAHYQGTTWTSYLAEHCIHDLAVAPDGSVWLGANAYDNDRDIAGPVGIYVITPEAMPATG